MRLDERVDIPVKVGADLVRLARTEGVALSAAGLEETRTLARVTCNQTRTRGQIGFADHATRGDAPGAKDMSTG